MATEIIMTASPKEIPPMAIAAIGLETLLESFPDIILRAINNSKFKIFNIKSYLLFLALSAMEGLSLS